MGKKILVADDSSTIQKVIKLALTTEGYDILAVSEGQEAVRAIREEHPDIVLIDIALPGADAVAIKTLFNQDPSFANVGFILMVSAFERVDERILASVGFHGRLIKPFDPSNLRKIVSDTLNRPSAASATPSDLPPVAPTSEEPIISGGGSEIEIADFDLSSEVKPEHLEGAIQIQPNDLPALEDQMPTITEPAITSGAAFTIAPMEVVERKTKPSQQIPVVDAPASAQEQVTAERELENDIKGLTESTIKMSKLDEYDWNLDDAAKMKQPPPPPKLSVVQDSGSPGSGLNIGIPTKPIDDGGSSFLNRKKLPDTNHPELELDFSNGDTASAALTSTFEAPAPVQNSAAATFQGSMLTRAEIEELVRKELRAMLEGFAREEAPRIAETVIRQEIEKILSK